MQTHFRTGGCGPADAAAIAASIVCPTLILAGEDDPVCPAVGADRLAAWLTNAAVDTHVLPAIGHGVFRQAPERSFALVREFLAR